MPSGPLHSKVVFITGASRGIGRAIALRCAADGASLVIAAKTATPHTRLPGTIHTVASEVEALGAEALPLQLDVRNDSQIEEAVRRAVDRYGGIDVLVNNASAISLLRVADLPLKRFDLMMQINVRGTYACTRACLPHLRQAANPHVLTMSPPLTTRAHWYGKHLGNAVSKYGMTMCTLGFAEEFRPWGIAANSLWPRTLILTEAVRVFFPDVAANARHPTIVADAAAWILRQDSRKTTGQAFVDEDVLRNDGVTDFAAYAVDRGTAPAPDIYLD